MRADRMTHYIGRLHPIIAEVPAVFSSTFLKRTLTSLGDLFIDLSRSGKRIGLPITEVTCAKRIEPHPPHATPRHVTRPFHPPQVAGCQPYGRLWVRVRQGSGFHTMAEPFSHRV